MRTNRVHPWITIRKQPHSETHVELTFIGWGRKMKAELTGRLVRLRPIREVDLRRRADWTSDVDLLVLFFPEARKAELTLFIGDRTAWGKGYGTESVQLALDALRAHTGIDRAEVDVPEGNDRALAFWEKLGFRHDRTDRAGSRWLELPLRS